MLRGISTWDSHGVDFNTTPYTILAQIFGINDKEAFLMKMLLLFSGKSWTSVQRTRRGHSGSTRFQSVGDNFSLSYTADDFTWVFIKENSQVKVIRKNR